MPHSSPNLSPHPRNYLEQIELIDEQLIVEAIPIYQRPPLALQRFAQRLNLDLPTHPARRAIEPDDDSPEAYSIRLYQWYEQRYGRRQEKPFAIGIVAAWIQGDFFQVNIPLKMSDNTVAPLLSCYGPLPDGVAPFTQPQLLDLVEGMNPALKYTIHRSQFYDVLHVATAVEMGMKAFVPLHLMNDVPLFHEASGELKASAFYLLEQKPRFHYSRWTSVLAVEKTVKAYLREQATESHLKGLVKRNPGQFGYGHDLDLLYNLAESYGLPRPPQKCIDFVQCDQAVRYGEVEVSRQDAANAHFHALQLVGGAARKTAELLKRPLPEVPAFTGTVRVGRRTFTGTLHEIWELDEQERPRGWKPRKWKS